MKQKKVNNKQMGEKKPQLYFSSYFKHPDFNWKFFGFGIFVGRIKQMGENVVWNVYTPWFSFGYAW